jgi:uncharacterized protein (DUF169 family)
MTTIEEMNEYGEELERLMVLRTSPVAVKMLQSEDDIPEGAIRPKSDRGYHLAQCQVFTMSRRQGMTVAMLKEDNWCWGPLLAYGLIKQEIGEKYRELQNDLKKIPLIEYGKYIGIVTAPLKTATFEPDVVMIYCIPAQLRSILHALSFIGEGLVTSAFYPIASCAFSVVPSLSGEYYVTLPDPGEYGRAMAAEDEIIFSVPKDKLEGIVNQLKRFGEMRMGYRQDPFLELSPDFPRPDFYKRLYRECGLDADDVPTWEVP